MTEILLEDGSIALLESGPTLLLETVEAGSDPSFLMIKPSQIINAVPFVTIVGITDVDGTHVTIEFSFSVTIDTGPTPDSGLVIDGNPLHSVAVVDSTHVTATLDTPTSPGGIWSLSAQPNWLTTLIQVPENDVIL